MFAIKLVDLVFVSLIVSSLLALMGRVRLLKPGARQMTDSVGEIPAQQVPCLSCKRPVSLHSKGSLPLCSNCRPRN